MIEEKESNLNSLTDKQAQQEQQISTLTDEKVGVVQVWLMNSHGKITLYHRHYDK